MAITLFNIAKKYPDGTTIFFEEVRTGRRELAAQTIWKMKRGIPNDLLHIFADPKDLNAQSDSAIPPANTIPSSSENSSAFVMKDGESLKNDSGEPVLIYHDKAPKGAIWGNKRFRSDNAYGIANYAIVGDDAHIRMTSSGGSGKRYLFFTIPDFRNQTISEIQQAVQKIDPDSTYPLGRNFDDVLNALHDHGMRVYPSGLKPLQNASASANRNRETAVPEKGTVKENLEVAPQAEETETVTINSTADITDEDFNRPFRNIILPSLPQKLLDLINKKSKPVLLKKNILEKNKEHHKELSADDNRNILDAALYHAELVGQSQPDKRPNYWVAVKLDSAKNAVVVFDVQETKTHHEIVGWYFVNEKGLENLQKQAAREGGQILDMRNKSQSPSDQTGTGNNDNIEDIPDNSSPSAQKIQKASASAEKTDSEGNTIAFSIAGEKGASRMKNAETLLDNLRIAKEMESAGKDAKEIKLATGWEKGGDGKWRMEIPDLKISDTALDRSLNYMAGEAGELLDAPELFEAYPELRNINIITVMEHENKLPENVGGRYDEKRKTIFVNAKATELARYEKQILETAREDIEESWNLSKEELEMRKELEIETDPKKIRKNAYKRIAKLEAIQKEKFQGIIIHEIQHAIQKMEGFARGGSINAETKLSLESAHKARANALRKHLADAGFEVNSEEAMLLTDEKADDVKLGKLWDKLVDNGMTEEKYNEIYSRIPLFIGYYNLAGEVESRNADRRSRMTMEERRQSLLDETADVAPEDRIYLMEEAGVSELAVGDKFSQIKDTLQPEEGKTPLFTEKYNSVANVIPMLAEIFNKFPNDIVAADGATVLIKNPDEKSGEITKRFLHLIKKFDDNSGNRNIYDIKSKIPWLPRTVETLENAQAKLKDPQTGNYAYIRSYKEGAIHTVFVTKSGVIQGQEIFDHGLKTQFADRFANKRDGFDVVWEGNTSKQKSSPQTVSHMESSGKFPRPFRQDKYTPESAKVNPSSAKDAKNSSGTFTEDDGSKIKFSIRKDAPPEKTKTGYKVFAVFKRKPGQLFPPMVANPGGASTPVGVWLDADAAPRAEDSKTGRPRVQAGGKGTNAGKQTLAYRPGWHLGEVPQAKQFNRLNKRTLRKELFPNNFVWAECEIAADVDYQKEAESYGYNANGNFQHALAGLPKIPVDGYYTYRTNPDPETEPWFITGAMKVKRILSDKEVNAILKENGYPEIKRQGGEMDLADWGLDNIAFSLADDRQPDSENKPAMSEEKEQSLLAQVKTLFDDAKTVVDKKWVMLNRQAYPVLYRTVFPTASKVPETPSPREMEIMNMVLENGSMAEAALVAEPYYNDPDMKLKKDLDEKRTETLKEYIKSVKGVRKTLAAFTDVNKKDDISLLEKIIVPPMWIAKKMKNTVVNSIYQAAQMFNDDKSRIFNYLSGTTLKTLDNLYNQDRSMYNRLNTYLLDCDRNQTGAGRVSFDKETGLYVATDANGKKVGEFDNEENAWDALFVNEKNSLIDSGYSSKAADA